MTLSNIESRIVEQAVELLAKEKTEDSDSIFSGAPSVLRQISKINHENEKLTGYLRVQIINAITKPLAFMFFMSHSYLDPNVVRELADYLDAHAGKELSLWYKED